jgi:Xaa-Pro aminopeptidase
MNYKIPDIKERNIRFSKIKEAMQKNDIYALIIGGKGHWWTGRGYFRYLTDFHLWGHDGLIYFPIDEEPSLVLTSNAVANKISKRGWVNNCSGGLELGKELYNKLDIKKIRNKKIGIVGSESIIPHGVLNDLYEKLDIKNIVNATDLFDKVKMAKTEWEIKQIKNLWMLAQDTMVLFQDNIVGYSNNNKSQLEICSDINKVLWENGVRDLLVFYGDKLGSYQHPTNRKINIKDKVRYHLEICGPSGHWLEITLNLAFKKINNYELRLMSDELEIFDNMLNCFNENTNLEIMANKYEKFVSRYKYEISGSVNSFDFHGQGLDTIEKPYYNKDIYNSSQNWKLENNTVISYHPKRVITPNNIWTTGINEDIYIKKNKAVKFSRDWNHNWRNI